MRGDVREGAVGHVAGGWRRLFYAESRTKFVGRVYRSCASKRAPTNRRRSVCMSAWDFDREIRLARMRQCLAHNIEASLFFEKTLSSLY
jgi:hypothetical protein